MNPDRGRGTCRDPALPVPSRSASRRSKSWKGLLRNTLKVLVFILSAVILVRMIDWPEFWRSLRDVSPAAFGAAVLLNIAAAAVMALRWKLLILAAGHRLPLRTVCAYTFLGMFYNQILPGSISGDAARIWCLGGRHTSWGKSAGIVLWDRVMGLVALLFITLVTLPLFWEKIMGPGTAALLGGVLLAGLAVFGALHQGTSIRLIEGCVAALAGRVAGKEGLDRAVRLFAGVRALLENRVTTLAALALSLVVRGLWLLGAWILSLSMGLPVPFLYYFFAIPLVELVRMVPLSIQGLGVRELALVFFLSPWGVSPARAALLSMLFFTALTVAGLAGGALYATRGLWGAKEATGADSGAGSP